MYGLIWVLIATAAGGVLKGATGAGVPILGVPILAMLYDVRVAVTVFATTRLRHWGEELAAWLDRRLEAS